MGSTAKSPTNIINGRSKINIARRIARFNSRMNKVWGIFVSASSTHRIVRPTQLPLITQATNTSAIKTALTAKNKTQTRVACLKFALNAFQYSGHTV